MSLPQQSNFAARPQEQNVAILREKEMIQARVESRLKRSSYAELHGVSCDYHEGVVTLRGRVSSYYLKQMAQALVFRLDGVQELNNRVEVVSPRDT
jgi:osmotically-inducible protein OsmY